MQAIRISRGIAIAGLALLAAAPAATPSSSATRATVSLVDRDPVVVSGTGFAPSERVTLRVRPVGGPAFSRVVTVRRSGRFVTTFATREVPECAAVVVTAMGARGTRATLQARIPPPCGVWPQP